MKKIFLSLIVMLFFVGIVYAEKTITITLTDEEYDALTVLTVTPEQWANDAIKNKAKKMINELVNKYSDKQAEKISETEKKEEFKKVDLEKEKKERKGK